MKKIKFFLMLVFVAMLFGCAGYKQHRVLNIGHEELSDVTIFSGGRCFNHGYVIPDSSKGYSGSFNIDTNVVVRWIKDNKEYSKTINLEKSFNLGGEIKFILDGQDVKVEY